MIVKKPFSFVVPWPAKPKARPRVTGSQAYMPSDYRKWKARVADFIALSRDEVVEGKCRVEMVFREKDVAIRVVPVIEDWRRAKGVRGDIDNLVGGMLDAMQDSGMIDDDRNVIEVHALIQKRRNDG